MITPVEFHERRRAELLLDPPGEWASVASWLAALHELDVAILRLKVEALHRLLLVQMDGPEVTH